MIKIRKVGHIYANNSELREYLNKNAGKWVEVETDYLFHNQYNIEKFRIYDSMVEAVKNDKRIGLGKCNYCGKIVKTGETCNTYPNEKQMTYEGKEQKCSDYGIEWFTADNTFFLKYPNGLKHKAKRVLSIHDDCKRFGSYYLESYPELGYYRLYNCRQTINFKYKDGLFFVSNGIGFNQKSKLPIPHEVFKKLFLHLNQTKAVLK